MNDNLVLRAHRAAVIRYWERARLMYNGALLLVTALAWGHSIFKYQGIDHAVRFDLFTLIALVFFSVAANLCYSVVYLIEFLVMGTGVQPLFHHYRWVLLVAGLLFALSLAYVIAYGLFGLYDLGF